MKCPECGYENLEGEAYCFECGAVLGDETIISIPDDNIMVTEKAVVVINGKEYELKPGENVVGREKADIELKDPEDYVSRKHCVISFHNGKLSLVDTSLNGTYVNGERVEKNNVVDLNPNDDLRFARANAKLKVS